MGHYGVHLGSTGPRWAPCWPHEHCYLRRFVHNTDFNCSNILKCWSVAACLLCSVCSFPVIQWLRKVIWANMLWYLEVLFILRFNEPWHLFHICIWGQCVRGLARIIWLWARNWHLTEMIFILTLTPLFFTRNNSSAVAACEKMRPNWTIYLSLKAPYTFTSFGW